MGIREMMFTTLYGGLVYIPSQEISGVINENIQVGLEECPYGAIQSEEAGLQLFLNVWKQSGALALAFEARQNYLFLSIFTSFSTDSLPFREEKSGREV